MLPCTRELNFAKIDSLDSNNIFSYKLNDFRLPKRLFGHSEIDKIASETSFGRSWGALGTLLGVLGSLLGCSWAIFGASWPTLGQLGAIPGSFWGLSLVFWPLPGHPDP